MKTFETANISNKTNFNNLNKFNYKQQHKPQWTLKV